MTNKAFCSLCGLKLRISELFICRDCGVLMCPFCLNHARGRKNFDKYQCTCGSTEVRSVGILRNWITSELLTFRKRLKKAAYRSIVLYQRWERLYEEMALLSKFFVVHNLQLREAIEIISRSESFVVENVREFAFKFKAELDRLTQSKAYQIDVLLQIRTHVRYLQKQADVFDSVLKEKLIVAEREISRAEETLEHIQVMRRSLGELSSILKPQPGEMIIGIVPEIQLHGSRSKIRKGLILVSNKKIRVVELMPSRFLPRKSPHIVDEFLSADILSIKVKSRKFRRQVLDIYTSLGHKYFTGSLSTLRTFENYLKRSIDGNDLPNKIPSQAKLSQKKVWKVTGFKKKLNQLLSLKEVHRNIDRGSSFNINLLNNQETSNSPLSDLLHQKQVAQRLLKTLKESMALGCIEPDEYYIQKDKIEEKIHKIEQDLHYEINSDKAFSVPSW